MGLSYAGVDISRQPPELAALIDRWWVREAPALWEWPGYGMERLHHLPIPSPPNVEPARLNTLVWPTGASRWASFVCLVGGVQAAAIETAIGTTAPTHQTLSITDDTQGTSRNTEMFMIGLRPVFVQDGAAQLWLMQLVDERYFWWTRQLTYTFAAGNSWTTLLTNLVTATGSAGALTVATPNTAYGSPNPARWSCAGRPLPLLIDAAAKTVGLRFVRRLDGTLAYVAPAAAEAADLAQFNTAVGDVVLGGRVRVNELVGNVPANVATAFWGDAQAVQTNSLASLALADYGSITGVSNTYGWVAADLDANAGATAKNNYAAQAATDYYLWALSLTDATFRGVQPVESQGQEDRIEWEYCPGREDNVKAEPVQGPLSARLPHERVLTRIVRQEFGDQNAYGDRPPVGYSYRVKLASQSSGIWKATIQIISGGVLADGPALGFGASAFNLYVAGSPSVGDIGVAIPDPYIPGVWSFNPSADGPNNVVPVVTEVCKSGTGGALWKCGGVMYSYVDPGANWLIANGAAVSRATYACLNTIAAAAGYAAPWGPGNGTTTFNVPTLTGPPQGYLRIADDTAIALSVERRDITLASAPGIKDCTTNPTDCCCANASYEGPGWYCTVPPGGNCFTDTKTVQFFSADPCATFVICSGPYATEAEATAACTGTFPTCASAPATMTETAYSDGCLNGLTNSLTRFLIGPPTWSWTDGNTVNPCVADNGFGLNCTGGVWTALYNSVPCTLVSQTSTTLVFQLTPITAPVTGTYAYFVVSI